MKLTRLTIIGFLAGFILGLGDYFLVRSFDVTMVIDGNDVTFGVVVLFAANFGALGAVIARLWERGKELEELQEQLVEAETLAAIGRMAAGVAHEVRNPLSVIRSSAQMLAEDAPMQDEEILNYITTEVDRLDAFVARVMDFSRPLDADLKVVNWKDLQQRLGRVVGEDVRFSGDATQFELDPDLTVQLLANLVENAQKSHAKQIEVRAQGSAIDVVDDGEGVCDEVRDQLFEPFVTSRAKGTGLGLAVARKLARVQGWELELAEGGLAPDGGGARFRLRQANT